jgi:hypothetical protein
MSGKSLNFRYRFARFLMNCAYRLSWESYIDFVTDGEFGYCPDCEQRMPDEPSWCR